MNLFDERSNELGELASALSLAQAEIEDAKKERENPAFKQGAKVSRYATLGSVWDAIREPLTKQGLSVVQLSQDSLPSTVTLKTVLLHKSGQYLVSVFSVPVTKQDAQGYGSAMTYARRYSLMAIVGVCPDDDDANAAVGYSAKPEPTRSPQLHPNPITTTAPRGFVPPVEATEINLKPLQKEFVSKCQAINADLFASHVKILAEFIQKGKVADTPGAWNSLLMLSTETLTKAIYDCFPPVDIDGEQKDENEPPTLEVVETMESALAPMEVPGAFSR